MITDLLKDSDVYEHEAQRKKPSPEPPYTIHTLMGDMRRWFEGDGIEYRDYRMDKKKFEILKAYYDEKEGMSDDGK